MELVTRDRYNLSYDTLLAEEAYNQADVINYATECIYLESGDFEALRALNEGVMDGIKQIIQKIIDSVRGMFKKFAASIGSLQKDHAAYCEKYKEIILNTTKYPPVAREISDYKDYDTAKISSFSVPEFNFDDKFKNMCTGAEGELNDGHFITAYDIKFDNNIQYKKGDANTGSLKDCIIKHCTIDDDKTLDFKDLNFKELYEYIRAYQKTADELKQDSDRYEANGIKINNVLTELEKETTEAQKKAEEAKKASDAAEEAPPTTADNKENGNGNTAQPNTNDEAQKKAEEAKKKENEEKRETLKKEISDLNDQLKKLKGTDLAYNRISGEIESKESQLRSIPESSVISYVYGDVLTELNISKPTDGGGSSSVKGYGSQDVADKKAAASTSAKATGQDGNEDFAQTLKNIESYKKGAKLFFSCAGSIVAAKLQMYEIYEKQTYELLKTRILDHVSPASKNNAANKKKSTDTENK